MINNSKKIRSFAASVGVVGGRTPVFEKNQPTRHFVDTEAAFGAGMRTFAAVAVAAAVAGDRRPAQVW